MTFQNLYDIAMSLWDKSGSSYMPKPDFDNFCNIKYNAWVQLESEKLEADEHYVVELDYLFKTISKPNSNFIDRVVDTPNLRKNIRFNITYKDPCDGKIKTKPIRIVSNNVIDTMMNDPYNKAIDADPLAIVTRLSTGNQGWQEFGETIPLTINMTYVENPQVINTATSPNTVFQGYDWVAYILVQLVVERMEVTIENFNRLKAEAADLQPQLQ